MTLIKKMDSWVTWGVAGAIIGFALGVNTISVLLIAIGLGGFIAYLSIHGPAQRKTEGRLFASGSALMMGWMLGFIVHGLAF